MPFFIGGASIPQPPTMKHIHKEIVERIKKGIYLLGDLVEPKTYTKLVLNDGVIERKIFTIEARHIPLEEIRSRIYKEHVELGLFQFCVHKVWHVTQHVNNRHF